MKRTFSPSGWSRDRGSSHSLSCWGSPPSRFHRHDARKFAGCPWCSCSGHPRSNDDHASDIGEPWRCSGSHRHRSNDDHAGDIAGPWRSSRENEAEIVPTRYRHADEHRHQAVGAASSSIPGGSSPPRKVTFLDTESSSDDSQTDTDEDDDNYHGYKTPVPRGDNLRVSYNRRYGGFQCPVCPGKKASRWRNRNEIRNHVVGMATSGRLKEEYKKKWSRHRVLARNEGWMQ